MNYLTISIYTFLFAIVGCSPSNIDTADQNENENCEFIKTVFDSLNLYYCKEYYDNGVLYREGKYVEDTAIDWHTFYNEDGYLKMKVDYVWLVGHTNSNPQQIIKFDINGDTIKSQSNYYRISCYDTIELGDTFYAKIDVSISEWDSLGIEYYFDIPHDSTMIRIINNQETYLIYDYVPNDTGIFKMSGSMEIFDADSLNTSNDTVMEELQYIQMFFREEYYVKEKKTAGNNTYTQ